MCYYNQIIIEEFSIFIKYFKTKFDKLMKKGVKVIFSGRDLGLPKDVLAAMNNIVKNTKDNKAGILNICLNYGGRDEITRATRNIAKDVEDKKLSIQDIDEDLFKNYLYTKEEPDPDLLIRTSGELRTSGFLPWQIVYSEFVFIEKNWPDFAETDLEEAITIYQKRNRKFGAK